MRTGRRGSASGCARVLYSSFGGSVQYLLLFLGGQLGDVDRGGPDVLVGHEALQLQDVSAHVAAHVGPEVVPVSVCVDPLRVADSCSSSIVDEDVVAVVLGPGYQPFSKVGLAGQLL